MGRPKIVETPAQIRERRELAVIVRTLRGVVGWSQQDVADRLGWERTSLTKFETGQMRPSRPRQDALMALLSSTGVAYRRTPRGLTVFAPETVLAQLDATAGLSLPARQPRRSRPKSAP